MTKIWCKIERFTSYIPTQDKVVNEAGLTDGRKLGAAGLEISTEQWLALLGICVYEKTTAPLEYNIPSCVL